MKHFLLFLIALTMAVAASAQNYRRPTPNKPARHAVAAQTVEIQCDTVANPPADSVVVTGFDKQLRSKRETMFVSNHTARTITSITLRIDYFDMAGHQLHSATHSTSVDLPPGQTRQIEVPAFDRTDRFYYHLSPAPTRAQQATPFTVTVTVLQITHPKL